MLNITTSGAQTVAGKCKAIEIVINNSLTGTIIVQNGTTTVATITNPTVGMSFHYGMFNNNVVINPSAICDITVNVDGGRGDLL